MSAAAPPRIVDPALPQLATICSPEAMASVLDEQVLPSLAPGTMVEGITIDRIDFRPGQQAVLLYSVRTGNPGSPLAPLIGTFGPPGGENRFAPEGPHAIALPGLGGFVELFPHDSGLPALRRVVSPSEMQPRLAGLLPGAAGSVTAEVLQYRPHRRCTLRYVATTPGDGASVALVGKLYRTRRRAQQAWEAHCSLWAAPGRIELQVPEPLALVEDSNLVVMAWVPGHQMRAQLIDGSPDCRGLTERAAAVLREVHGLEPPDRPPVAVADGLDDLRVQVGVLAGVAPAFAREISVNAELASTALSTGESAAVVRVHGDFTPSQLIVGDEGLALVDFDRAAAGDPAVDVGMYVAKLVRDAVLEDRADLLDLVETFLDAYGAHGSLRRRSRVVQSLALTRIAASRFRQDPLRILGSEGESIPRLLREARACLENQ